MARDREVQCIYYICEGKCLKKHVGTFKDACQICKDYKRKPNGRPRRKDLRKEKEEKWIKDKRNYEEEY